MKRSLATRLLHLLVAAVVIHQLVTSFLMQMPRPQGRAGDLGFELHEAVGTMGLGILMVFWVWTLARRRETEFSSLVHWFSAARRGALIKDFWMHVGAVQKLELRPESSPLADAVHGLGLLLASTMAVSGAVVFVVMGTDGTMNALGGSALGIHRTLANVIWAYLIGHASIALLHQVKGHHVLERMFTT